MSQNAPDTHAAMLHRGYDVEKILQAGEVQGDTADPGVVEVQNFLKHYGYFDHGPAAEADEPRPGFLDKATLRALVEFQMRYDVGTPGVLDEPTKAFMVMPRCGLADLVGGSSNFAVTGAWPRRNLSYQFGRPGASSLTGDLPQGVTINAVRRALNTWANAGVGLTFRVITGGDIAIDADIRIEWRVAADPDYTMVGAVLAHADYPPGFSVVTTDYPKPLHFDDEENTWVDGAVPGGYDVETVTLHELGHLLGLQHSTVPGTVMWPTTFSNFTLRTLQPDDLAGIRSLYPVP